MAAAAALEAMMQALAEERMEEAYALGLGRELGPDGKRVVQDYVQRNERFLGMSFAPDVRTKLTGLAGGMAGASVAARQEQVHQAMGTFRGRATTYAGPYWANIWEGMGQRVHEEERARMEDPAVEPEATKVRINRLLDPYAEHCSTCPPKAGVFDSWEQMVAVCDGIPADGSDECGCNCRCWLEWEGEPGAFGPDVQVPKVLDPKPEPGSPEARLAELNGRFGEFSGEKARELMQAAEGDANKAYELMLSEHIAGLWEALDAENAGRFVPSVRGMPVERLESIMRNVEDITEWALRNEFPGQSHITLYHGGSTEQPSWLGNVRMNTSFTDNPFLAAHKFGPFVTEANVPIDQVRSCYRYSPYLRSAGYKYEQEFILKGGVGLPESRTVEEYDIYREAYRGQLEVLPGTWDEAKELGSRYHLDGSWWEQTSHWEAVQQ